MKIKIPISYQLCLILVGLFSFLRIYRNSINYYSTATGGVWNIIVAVFIAIAMFELLLKSRYTLASPIKYALFYAVVAVLNALINLRNYSFSNLYNICMLFSFPAVLICFFKAELSNYESPRKNAAITLITCIPVAIMAFISVYWYSSGRLEFSMVSNVYYFLCLFPLLLFRFQNKLIHYAAYAFVAVCLVFSGKRTGFLALVAFVLIVLFVDALIARKIRKFIRGFFVAAIAIVLFVVLYERLSQVFDLRIIERIINMADDGGSGRDVMYAQLWEAIKDSDLLSWIFGHGYDTVSSVLIGHDYAHQDFLETLFNYGIVSTILLIGFYLSLVSIGFKMLKARYPHAGIYLGSVVISLFLSMFSVYCITYTYACCGMATLGVLLADWCKFKERLWRKKNEVDYCHNT